MDEMVDAHFSYVWGLAAGARLGPEAERIPQEVFLAMGEWVNAKKKMPDDPRAMLTRITWNKINDLLAEVMAQRARASEVDLDLMPASVRNPEELLASAEISYLTEGVIATLPEDDAGLLRRVDCDGESQEDIAAALGQRSSSLRRRLAEIRATVRDLVRWFYESGEDR